MAAKQNLIMLQFHVHLHAYVFHFNQVHRAVSALRVTPASRVHEVQVASQDQLEQQGFRAPVDHVVCLGTTVPLAFKAQPERLGVAVTKDDRASRASEVW